MSIDVGRGKDPQIEALLRKLMPERGTGRCAICSDKICVSDFRDEISIRECEISGMCQRCQDGVFEEE